MTDEQVKQVISSILGEAGKGVTLWMNFLNHEELADLLSAARVIVNMKETALLKQKEETG